MAPNKPKVRITIENKNTFKFMFQDEYTKITGRVSVWSGDNRPDQRTASEKKKLAQQRIKAISAAFALACKEEFDA